MNIYDFDNTIYDGDSSVDFYKFALKKNKKCLFILPGFLVALFLYLIKIKDKEYLKSKFFKFIKYIDIDKYTSEFWNINEDKIKEFYRRKKNDEDIIVSASLECLLKPLTDKLNVRLIATKIDLNTGKLIGKNCYGEEKVERLKKDLNISSCDEFYSDSMSDLPLSKIAKNSYIVKKEEIIKWDKYKESKIKRLIKAFLNRDFITFVTIGIINVINGIWLALFYNLFIKNDILAYVVGFLTSLTIAYILNTKWNFKKNLSIRDYFKYFINNIPNFIIQIVSVFVFIKILEVNKLLSYSISAILSVPITFILVKLNVYKK